VINKLKALFQKEPTRSPQAAAADFQKRLQLAKLQLAKAPQPKGEFVEPMEVPPMEAKPDIAAPDQSFSCPAYAPIEESALAGALERIIERHKISDQIQCRINGVPCAKGWPPIP
jgi:hypothetical protein